MIFSVRVPFLEVVRMNGEPGTGSAVMSQRLFDLLVESCDGLSYAPGSNRKLQAELAIERGQPFPWITFQRRQ